MGRTPRHPDSANECASTSNTTTSLCKRNPNQCQAKSQIKPALHRYLHRNRHTNGTSAVSNRSNHKGLFSLFPLRGTYLLYFMAFLAVFGFAMASMVLQSSIASVFGSETGLPVREAMKLGTRLRFAPRRVVLGDGLDRLRSQPRIGVRPPRIGLILGNMKKDPRSLMLITLVKNLQRLGYVFKIYAVENGTSHSMWERMGGQISILGPEQYGHVDWSIFEGIIADSLEAKEAISSLMQEPFHSIPLIWVIQEDTLANRLPLYVEKGSKNLLSDWKSTFSRASVVVFPDFSLPMLYSVLDTGNFFVITGSPVDVWAAEIYSKNHVKYQLRKENGFLLDDILVLVVGSSFFYNELSWDYAVAMHDIGPLLIKYARRSNVEGSFKFVFLCGNSTDGYNNALQEVASRLGLLQGSIRHYGLNTDVNSVLLMADIVLYGSSQVEQGFPSLIIRAMTFGIPVITPDYPIIKKHLEERMDSDSGVWDDIYRKARKSEKLKFEANERDEGELERTGQPVCIYEIYGGAGAWPFLHHGSLYRGLSLSTAARRLRSDDVDAVGRLPLLNFTYYRDILCEIGGMFSIANRVDSIHKRPWIGFQSWRAAGRKVSLSIRAEKVLEETLQETKSDVMYFWAHLDMDGGFPGSNKELTFWSICDILNGGYCRAAFEDAFRKMYDLPSHIEALPPMPVDGGLWSALHSWVMPTPSFLEFMMFSRMFADSLDALHNNSSEANMCLLNSSDLERTKDGVLRSPLRFSERAASYGSTQWI